MNNLRQLNTGNSHLCLVHRHEGLLDDVSDRHISSLLHHRTEVVKHAAPVPQYHRLLKISYSHDDSETSRQQKSTHTEHRRYSNKSAKTHTRPAKKRGKHTHGLRWQRHNDTKPTVGIKHQRTRSPQKKKKSLNCTPSTYTYYTWYAIHIRCTLNANTLPGNPVE